MNQKPILLDKKGNLPVAVFESNEAMGLAAALDASVIIRQAIAERGEVNIVLATGNSQLTFLHALSKLDGIDWSKAHIFHMDEYLGLKPNHPSSFPAFLHRHFVDVINSGIFYPVPGSMDNVQDNCRAYEALIRSHPTDLVAMGIGESGHLAFNDPPEALFFDPEWVKVVKLPIAAQQQQINEGHFKTLDEVPTHAITLTIPALLAAKYILCIVPESRKAGVVYSALLEPISEDVPGSILRTVRNAKLYLDRESAAKTYSV
jgi:glucosamine-6-phosphate deaminase